MTEGVFSRWKQPVIFIGELLQSGGHVAKRADHRKVLIPGGCCEIPVKGNNKSKARIDCFAFLKHHCIEQKSTKVPELVRSGIPVGRVSILGVLRTKAPRFSSK